MKRLFHEPRKPSLKEKISSATILLESTSIKLRNVSEGLKNRDQRFFEKCIEAEVAHNHPRAIMYANECAQVRRFASLVLSSELALEQASLRLQTMTKLGDVLESITPVMEIVEETKTKLARILPSSAEKLNEVNSVLMSSFSSMNKINSNETPVESYEAAKILKEANQSAEESIRERFPRIPENISEMEQEFKIPVALTATGGSDDGEEESLKQLVYEYIKARGGKLDLLGCASFLGISNMEVEDIVLELKDEGKVSI